MPWTLEASVGSGGGPFGMTMILGVFLFVIVPVVLAGAVLRCVWLEYRSDRIPILLYHRLISQEAADAGEIRDDEMIYVAYDTRFAEQTAYLREAGYTTLDLDDYLKIRSGEMPRPTKPLIVTFDDGYLSNYVMAYPELRRHGHKAVVFVAPEPDEHTRDLVAGVDGFLSAEQMREMAANGISIQSHTMTHCILTALDDEEARRELEDSRRHIAELSGHPVDHIAIPRAGYSRRIRRLVARAGYRTACTNAKGSANCTSDRLALPRIVVERDMTLADFVRCLTPRSAATLRIVGNVKRIPELVGGARFARWLRSLLYVGPLKAVFRTRNLKKVIAALAVAYATGCVLFIRHLLTS